MSEYRWVFRIAGLCAAFLFAGAASALTQEECIALHPAERGQSGKDVIWIPTSDELVTGMLQMARTQSSDVVYDLGAGDGKIAIAAAKQFGARAVGIEYNPQMVQLGQCMVQAAGVTGKVKILQGDIFKTDFNEASVITLYLLPDLNLKLRPTLLKMKPGTRIVSHAFTMGEWEPDERLTIAFGNAYLWIVPADVDGHWTFRQQGGNDDFSVDFEQAFQHVSGKAGTGRNETDIGNVTLRGDQLQFILPNEGQPATIDGRVNGNRIEATMARNGKRVTYIGTRS